MNLKIQNNVYSLLLGIWPIFVPTQESRYFFPNAEATQKYIENEINELINRRLDNAVQPNLPHKQEYRTNNFDKLRSRQHASNSTVIYKTDAAENETSIAALKFQNRTTDKKKLETWNQTLMLNYISI